MSWIFYNANPENNRIGDCVIRAISTALGKEWREVYIDLCVDGIVACELPNADGLWGKYLKRHGFTRETPPCRDDVCMTVNQFCEENQKGVFLLCPNNHIVAAIDGNFYDIWDCGNEIINYYWRKEE